MSDTLLRAIARDAGIQICAASTTELVERAHEIHSTTPLATAALGRTLTATAIMGSQLKVEDGSVTVQIKGNGPLGAIVCVGDSDGYVRGYLQDPAVDLPLRADGKLNVGGGVGRGYLMVIKDIGLKDPITGTVALVNGEIAEDLTRYFAESEQIPSACALGVLVNPDGSVKAAGGFIMQLMPNAAEETVKALEDNIFLMDQLTTILDEDGAETVIAQVFKGLEWHKTAESDMAYKCYCSRERVLGALASLSADDLASLREEQKDIEVRCQFCDAVYNFTPEEIAALNAPKEDEKE